MFEASVILHVASSLLCIVIVALATRAMRREPRWQPLAGWVFVAFVSTVAVGSIQRAAMPILPPWEGWPLLGVSLQLLATVMLVAVFALSARQARIVPELAERARRSAREYDRARRDYEQLVRHRIGNPLAVVQGVAHTLDAHPDLHRETREQLLRSLVDAAEELTRVALHPESTSPEELELRAVPARFVDEPRGVRPSDLAAAAG